MRPTSMLLLIALLLAPKLADAQKFDTKIMVKFEGLETTPGDPTTAALKLNDTDASVNALDFTKYHKGKIVQVDSPVVDVGTYAGARKIWDIKGSASWTVKYVGKQQLITLYQKNTYIKFGVPQIFTNCDIYPSDRCDCHGAWDICKDPQFVELRKSLKGLAVSALVNTKDQLEAIKDIAGKRKYTVEYSNQ